MSLSLLGKDDKKKADVQCLDPYAHTNGGTAVFEIQRVTTKPDKPIKK